MGFTVYYSSVKQVDASTEALLRKESERLSVGKTWLSCEPVSFFARDDDGRMTGGSKPNFIPDPLDRADAEQEDLPDGTISNVLEHLAIMSRSHGIDWELSHEHYPGPIGYIRDGEIEPALVEHIDQIAEAVVATQSGYIGVSNQDQNDAPSIRNELYSGNISKLRKILEAGADPNEDEYLEELIGMYEIEVANLLLDFGAVPNENCEQTALTLAAKTRSQQLMARLIKLGQNIDGNSHASPLGFAAGCGDLPTVKFLVAEGASIDCRTSSGLTPLMVAAYWGHKTIVQFLLDHGANPNLATTKEGITAIEFGKMQWASSLEQFDRMPVIYGASASLNDKRDVVDLLEQLP